MNKFLVNNEIRVKFLKVVDNNGNFLGNLEKSKALEIAKEKNLDLVLINQKSDPPLAKILDYGKLKYELEKKEKDLRKKNRLQRQVMKEVNIRLNTGEWDLKRIQKKIEEWLEEGHKVKINMILKGRENKFKNSAEENLRIFVSSVKDCKTETDIRESPKGFCVVLSRTQKFHQKPKESVTTLKGRTNYGRSEKFREEHEKNY